MPFIENNTLVLTSRDEVETVDGKDVPVNHGEVQFTLSELKDQLAELVYASDSFYHQTDRRRYLQERIVIQARREAVPTTTKQNKLKNVLHYWKLITSNHIKYFSVYRQTMITTVPTVFTNGDCVWRKSDALDQIIFSARNFWIALRRATEEATCSHPITRYSLDAECEPGDGVFYQHRCDACGGYLDPIKDLNRYE